MLFLCNKNDRAFVTLRCSGEGNVCSRGLSTVELQILVCCGLSFIDYKLCRFLCLQRKVERSRRMIVLNNRDQRGKRMDAEFDSIQWILIPCEICTRRFSNHVCCLSTACVRGWETHSIGEHRTREINVKACCWCGGKSNSSHVATAALGNQSPQASQSNQSRRVSHVVLSGGSEPP